MNIAKTLLKNPLLHWLRWFRKKLYFEWKYRARNLQIGYMADFSDCDFGCHNTLYDRASLVDVDIGDYSYVGANSRIWDAEIGKFTCIGPDVVIGLGRHPSHTFVSVHPIFYATRSPGQIAFMSQDFFKEFERSYIGSDVWIGARAIIIDGARIGDGAIIGAGAVVTADVPSYAVVGGVPAKVLRYRFEADDIAFLNDFKWWNMDPDWLREHAQKFHNIHEFSRFCRAQSSDSQPL